MNVQRPARRLFPEGSLRWDPETGMLLSSDEEIIQAVTGKLVQSAPEPRVVVPHANNTPGLYGPLRVERFNGGLAVIGLGKVRPVDTRIEGEELIRELEGVPDLPFPPVAPGHAAPALADSPSLPDAASVQGLQEGTLSLQKGAVELDPDRLGNATTEAASLPLLEKISCA